MKKDILEIVGFNKLNQEYFVSHNRSFQIAYSCLNANSLIVFEIILYDPYEEDPNEKEEERIFYKKWFCSRPTLIDMLKQKSYNTFNLSEVLENGIGFKTIDLKLSDKLTFRPDFLHKIYEPKFKLKVILRMVDKNKYNQFNLAKDLIEREHLKREYKGYLTTPFSRLSKTEFYCLDFLNKILYDQELKLVYQCDYEEG